MGLLFSSKIPKSNSFLNLAVLNLTGMAFLVWLASIVEIAGKSYTSVLVIVVIFALLFSIFKIKKIQFSRIVDKLHLVLSAENIQYIFFTLSLGVITAFLHNPTLTSTSMSFRIGPDLAGWTAATQYFCQHSSRVRLSESILQQLGLQNISQAFRNPLQFPDTYIGRIPSFTDQVNGEFLIGANRVGLPKLLSGYCALLPDWLNNIMVGGIIWATITLSLLIIGILKIKEISPKIIMVVAFLSVFNVNTISVLMEGGYGQFISTPFLVAAIYFLQKQYFSQISKFLIVVFIVFSLNAYQDAIIIFTIFCFIYALLLQLSRGIRSKINLSISRRFLVYISLMILINAHQVNSFSRLLLERFKSSGVLGGWDQGKIAFPVNLLGLFNWLPYSSENHPWGFGFFLLTISLSIISVFLLVKLFLKRTALLSMSIFVGYLVISLMVYRKGLSTNNYQVWKLMAYATPIIFLDVFSALSSRLQAGARNYLQKVSLIVLILICLSTLTWMNDWLKYRSFSVESSKDFSERVLDKYDVLIIGNWTGSSVTLLLQGDVRYFLPSRGFGLPSLRSKPGRQITYLLPTGQCVEDYCLSSFVLARGGGAKSPKEFEMIYQDGDLKAFIAKEL